MFNLDRSCPLKLRRLFPYPAILDPCVRSAQLYRPLRPLFSSVSSRCHSAGSTVAGPRNPRMDMPSYWPVSQMAVFKRLQD